jgi:hypothetical protein
MIANRVAIDGRILNSVYYFRGDDIEHLYADGHTVVITEDSVSFTHIIDGIPTNIETMTKSEIKNTLNSYVNKYLDDTAMRLGYNTIVSMCSYTESSYFYEESKKAVKFRDMVWVTFFKIYDNLVKDNHVPTYYDLIKNLPIFENVI